MKTKNELMELSIPQLVQLLGNELESLNELEEKGADREKRMKSREHLEIIQKVIEIKKTRKILLTHGIISI